MEPMKQRLDDFPELRRELLGALKREGSLSIETLAKRENVTREAVRQQLAVLERDGWVRRRRGGRPKGGIGRPVTAFELTAAAEELFPKAYDALSVELLDAVADQVGPQALEKILRALVESRVKRFEPQLKGLSLEQRVDKLKALYLNEDPFMSVENTADSIRLVERNCPFFGVASRRPALCSVTVNALSRLLDRRVSREERFQSGHGRCAFVVKTDKAPSSFQLEK